MASGSRAPVCIDLLSETDSDASYSSPSPAAPQPIPAQERHDQEHEAVPAQAPGGHVDDDALNDFFDFQDGSPEPEVRGQYVTFGDEMVFVPDEEPAPPGPVVATAASAPAASPTLHSTAAVPTTLEGLSEEDCLRRILEIFPDICHDHVRKLYHDLDGAGGFEMLRNQQRLDNIVEQLVSAADYPKQEKDKGCLKRKREPSPVPVDDATIWGAVDRLPVPRFLKGPMQAMLKAEFPDIPTLFINGKLAEEIFFFPAYLALAKVHDQENGPGRLFGRGRPPKNPIDAHALALNVGWPDLIAELAAARRQVSVVREERRVEEAKKRAEQDNLERAKRNGTLAECSACFDELPINRQIWCDGVPAHFLCYDCALTYVKSEVGESRCRLTCTAGCGSPFSSRQLDQLSDKRLLARLAQLQQEQDIRDAALEDLEECPFCDYKVILPPIDEDFEFRCANPECEKISCRRCKCVSHIPLSCEQHAKENKINVRHKIEEAMTAALVRSCNNCKKQFIKEYGCNKMSCPSCHNLQCYVCSANVKDYSHFDSSTTGRSPHRSKSTQCPLYDDVEARHAREVEEAEKVARAEVVKENPDVSAEDLEIKVSDAVMKSTRDRRVEAARGPPGYFRGLGPYVGGGIDGAADLDLAAVHREQQEQLLLLAQAHQGQVQQRIAAAQRMLAARGRWVPRDANEQANNRAERDVAPALEAAPAARHMPAIPGGEQPLEAHPGPPFPWPGLHVAPPPGFGLQGRPQHFVGGPPPQPAPRQYRAPRRMLAPVGLQNVTFPPLPMMVPDLQHPQWPLAPDQGAAQPQHHVQAPDIGPIHRRAILPRDAAINHPRIERGYVLNPTLPQQAPTCLDRPPGPVWQTVEHQRRPDQAQEHAAQAARPFLPDMPILRPVAFGQPFAGIPLQHPLPAAPGSPDLAQPQGRPPIPPPMPPWDDHRHQWVRRNMRHHHVN